MALFGFIGAGNMGYPLIKATIKTFGKEQVVYTSASQSRRSFIEQETMLPAMVSNPEVAKECKYLVLAVKPQVFPRVLAEIKGFVSKDHIVLSIAAGITIDTIKGYLSEDIRVVRAMPNTPAMVEQGMTGVAYSADSYTNEEKDILSQFFQSFGKYELVEEALMNAVVCASGSSPAYVYMLIEALADSVVSHGIPRAKAYTMVAQTVLGAAAMVLESGEHPGRLKDNVCSPGGTTIAAVKALEEYGFRNAVMKATDACYQKCELLSQTNVK